jgi:hypothetical protein
MLLPASFRHLFSEVTTQSPTFFDRYLKFGKPSAFRSIQTKKIDISPSSSQPKKFITYEKINFRVQRYVIIFNFKINRKNRHVTI